MNCSASAKLTLISVAPDKLIMDLARLKGISFGATSGIITTLGMMSGLYFGTGSKLAVAGGIISIAIADSMSDALGVHVSEESQGKNKGEVWSSTLWTFIAKLVIASTFLVPVLFFPLSEAMLICTLWGLALLSLLSIYIAKENNENQALAVAEHTGIAIVVLIATYFAGSFIAANFA